MRRCLVWHCVVRCDSDRSVLVWDKSFPGSVKHGVAGFGFVRCITDWSVSVWNNNFQGGFLFGLV